MLFQIALQIMWLPIQNVFFFILHSLDRYAITSSGRQRNDIIEQKRLVSAQNWQRNNEGVQNVQVVT